MAALADAAGADGLAVNVLAYCGLRWGGLKVRRVDVLRRRLEVAEAASEVEGRVVWGTPKSHAVRSVPLPRFLVDDLAAALVGRGPDDLVFPAPEGGVLRVGNFRRRTFDRATAAAGVPGLVPHELWHTAASLAIAAGASIKAVQAMLGHASATVTLDRYGHLFPNELDAVGERLDAARALCALRPTRGPSVVELPSREAL